MILEIIVLPLDQERMGRGYSLIGTPTNNVAVFASPFIAGNYTYYGDEIFFCLSQSGRIWPVDDRSGT